jgi:hypothetical protein
MSNPLAGDSGLSTEELRAAVRAVLRDVLPAAVLDTARTTFSAKHETAGENVEMRTDADLDVFIRRLAAECSDPSRRAALQEGRHTFRLSAGVGRGNSAAASGAVGVVRVERGAVTERTVTRAAADGARLVLGKSAVMTPLARDKARSLGVAVDKES